MLDILVKSVNSNLTSLFTDYYSIYTVYNNDLDVEKEFHRTNSIPSAQRIKFLDETDGVVLLAYKRSPLGASEIGKQRHSGRLWSVSAADVSMAQTKDYFLGKFTINYKLLSNVREALEIFELIYNIKLKPSPDTSVSIRFEDTLQPLNFVYNTTFSDLSIFDPIQIEKYGSTWSIEFSVDINGVVISPESVYYPRLLKVKSNYFVASNGTEIFGLDENYLWTHLKEYTLNSVGQVVNVETGIIDDSLVISSRFNIT